MQSHPYSDSNIVHDHAQENYDQLWTRTKERLARGEVTFDPIPDATTRRWGVSVICHFESALASSLESVTRQMARLSGPEQLLYTPATVHTTVSALEFYRAPIAPDDDRVQRYCAILQHIARQFAPFEIRYQGLTATPIGVLAQGWPLDDSLQRLRHALREQLRAHSLLSGPEQEQPRQIAHASLIVFTSPLQQPAELAAFIEQNRATHFGTTTITTLDLVRYERSTHAALPIPLCSLRMKNGVSGD